MPEEKVELTPEMIAAIMNRGNQAVPQPVEPEQPKQEFISSEPFSFSSPDPEMKDRMTAFGAQSAPLTPFTTPSENTLNLLTQKPSEFKESNDLLEQKPVEIVAAPFSIGSFTPPPPVAPPVERMIPVAQPVVPVVKPRIKRRKKKANISQINVSRSK